MPAGVPEERMREDVLVANQDLVENFAAFVHDEDFLFFALVCRAWRSVWGDRPLVTRAVTVHTSASQLRTSFEAGLRMTTKVCNAAARVGNLEALQEARRRKPSRGVRMAWSGRRDPRSGDGKDLGYTWPTLCKWDSFIFTDVVAITPAESRERCPWDASTSAEAALGGHLEVVMWARKNGCPWDARTCTAAARRGQLEVLQWCRANGCPWDEWTCCGAALRGNLEVLQWCRANGCPWDGRTCSWAAGYGHLEVLCWARANGCGWGEWTCPWAAEGGHLEVLQWCRSNGCPWNSQTCSGAALGGHLAILQWARANGCPWDWETCAMAAKGGHGQVLQWAVDNGCPMN